MMSQVFIEFLYAEFKFIWLASWVESREYTKDAEGSSPTSTRYFLSALFTSMCTVFLSILFVGTPYIPVYRRENNTKRPVNLMQIKSKICISAWKYLQLIILQDIYLIFISRFVFRVVKDNDIKINFQFENFHSGWSFRIWSNWL